MAEKNNISDEDLERLLGQIGSQVPTPSDSLMARVLDDAETHRPVPGQLLEHGDKGVVATILGLIGGWKGASGLVTAGLVGVWIGISPPAALSDTQTSLLDVFAFETTDEFLDLDAVFWGSI